MRNFVVYKYPLEITDCQHIDLPEKAKFLSIHTQLEIPCMWFLVDPDQPREDRTIMIVGTGQVVENSLHVSFEFMGTFLILNDTFVGHVFMEVKNE